MYDVLEGSNKVIVELKKQFGIGWYDNNRSWGIMKIQHRL